MPSESCADLCCQLNLLSSVLQAFIFVLCQTGLRLNLAKFLEWGPSRRMLALQVIGTQSTNPVHLQKTASLSACPFLVPDAVCPNMRPWHAGRAYSEG